MKTKVLLMAFVIVLSFVFVGCDKIDDDSGNVVPEAFTSSKTTDVTEINARIEIQIEDMNGNNKVQIPKFVGDFESDAINSLNAQIETLVTEYETAKNNVLKWPEIYLYQYDTDKYLQAVVEYQQMPSIDLDYNVMTFVYDKKNDKEITLEDAYELADISSTKLEDLVYELFVDTDVAGEITKQEVNGFYISEKGNVEFFVRLYIDDGTQEYSCMTTIIPKSKQLLTTDENGLHIVE